MLGRTLRAVLSCVVLVSLLSACGGAGSSGSIEAPSVTGSRSPTRELPTPTRTTRTPHEPPAGSGAPAPSSTSEEAPPPGTSETTGGEGESSGDDWWWVVLVAALVMAVVVGLLLLHRSRRRRVWASGLATAEREAGWFARDLIPQLRGSGSPAGVSGGWVVAAPRIAMLDDRVSQLVSTAPGEKERARASSLRDAVRTARDRVVAVVGAGDRSTQWALDLDNAQAPLLEVLVVPSKSGDGEPA